MWVFLFYLQVKLRFRDAAAKPQMLGKTINNAKRLPDYKDSEEEVGTDIHTSGMYVCTYICIHHRCHMERA